MLILFRKERRQAGKLDVEEIVQKGQAGQLDVEEKCCLQ